MSDDLDYAIRRGNIEEVKMLLVAGASVKANNPNNYTPLHSAAARGDNEIIELLITCGADLNATTEGGVTPLYEATFHGHEASMLLLIKKGAKVNSFPWSIGDLLNKLLDGRKKVGQHSMLQFIRDLSI